MATAAVVSISMGVMKPVLAKLATLMGDEYKKIKGLQKDVTFLRRELIDMDALLEIMDNADELDPLAKNWRKDIIEMSYTIEDYIDDFMHHLGEKADDDMGIFQKALEYLRTFWDRHRIANQFQEIKTLVMEASERRKRYMLDQCISISTPVAVDPRISVLYKESASLVGIESQKVELVSWAMDEVNQLKFMAIVGFGGIGKTTLANEVYREVRDKFECKAFISVSQKPQMIEVLNSLLSQLGQRTYSQTCNLQDPINHLREHLQYKRYFIVVDDLWDTKAWNAIQYAFPRSDHSSRVIITTRNELLAARSCGHNNGQIYNMKHLSEQDSRKLFFDRIFGSKDACPAELMKQSCEILKKCDGLPLAIVTMASMLAYQPRELEAWEYILKSLGTKSAPNSSYEDMIYILDLSYKNLPRHLKACFLYLGSYPEDYEINKNQLIRRWVAEGFVSNSDGKHDVWDVAESYFNELVNRSMIQPTYMNIVGFITDVVSSCRVHDMLLELIVRRCKEDNFLCMVNDVEALGNWQDRVIRRLTVAIPRDAGDSKVDTSIIVRTNISQVRSLAILGASNWMPKLELKYIRVFVLKIPYDRQESEKMDLTCINQLAMLRYLKVDADNVALPAEIWGLRYLETLDLSGVESTIPTEIIDVPSLSHLLMPDDKGMWYMTGKMKSLRTLHGFCVPPESSESIVALGELTALSDLKLCFPAGWALPRMKTECMVALSNSLEKLCNLKRLCATMANTYVAWCADELSSLSPSFHKLEHLSMAGCRLSRVPKWVGRLEKLRVLHLCVKQIFQEDVAMIGRGSPSLIELRLQITSIPTKRIVIGGSTGFPVVKVFDFDCDGISHLTFEEGAMPELRDLSLVFDPDEWDNAAPGGLQHLPSLKKIEAKWPSNISHRFYDTTEGKSYRCCIHRTYYDTTEGAEKGRVTTAVFQEASGALLTRPAFYFSKYPGRIRPIEEDDYLILKNGAVGYPPLILI